MSAGAVFFLLLAAMGLTAGGMYGAYALHVRQRLTSDMRNILEEYVPLNSAPPPSSVLLEGSSSVPESFTSSVATPRLSNGMGVSTPRLSDGPSRLGPGGGGGGSTGSS